MSEEPKKDEQLKTRLPYEDMSHLIEAGRLARMLAHKGIISAAEFEWLVIAAYIRPKAEALNKKNWRKIRQELLDFLHREDLKPPPTSPSPPVQKN